MKTQLLCDLTLGGSTRQLIEYNVWNDIPAANLATQICYMSKTRPARAMKRAAALIGVVYDQMNGEERYLDYVIEAIKIAERRLQP